MPDPANKRIVITGATRGLGRAMVDACEAAGHTVLGCGRSPRDMDPQRFHAVDVSDAGQVQTWAESIVVQFGAPDLLINNAATMNTPNPFWEIPAAAFDQLMAVNVSGVANCIRSFLPAMIERGEGVIVNFSSGWGRTTDSNVSPYCASKWAIEGLSKALAQDLPPGLASVSFSPGMIDTDMLRMVWSEEAAAYPSPEEWATRAVPYLLKLKARDNGRPLTCPGS